MIYGVAVFSIEAIQLFIIINFEVKIILSIRYLVNGVVNDGSNNIFSPAECCPLLWSTFGFLS